MTDLKYHRFAEIFPLLEGKDFDDFVADIKANGQRVSILLYQGQVLDGRNRDRACRQLGLEPWTEEANVKDDDEALDLLASLNIQRRQLSIAQRAFAAARLANMREGGQRENLNASKTTISQDRVVLIDKSLSGSIAVRDASKRLGVSTASIGRARAIIAYGGPELENDVISGKTSLKAGAERVTPKRNKIVGPKGGGRGKGGKRAAREAVIQRDLANLNKLPKLRGLTRAEVDPDFVETSPSAFATKYGHVRFKTKTQLEQEAAETRVADLMAEMRAIMSTLDKVSPDDSVTWIIINQKEANYRRTKLQKFATDLAARVTKLASAVETILTKEPVDA